MEVLSPVFYFSYTLKVILDIYKGNKTHREENIFLWNHLFPLLLAPLSEVVTLIVINLCLYLLFYFPSA